MKFYDLDLIQLLPDNIEVNYARHVEYTNFINEFFLKGFYNYYNNRLNLNLAVAHKGEWHRLYSYFL